MLGILEARREVPVTADTETVFRSSGLRRTSVPFGLHGSSVDGVVEAISGVAAVMERASSLLRAGGLCHAPGAPSMTGGAEWHEGDRFW
jgi:hypothetical protein